jgi:hypothetical protein
MGGGLFLEFLHFGDFFAGVLFWRFSFAYRRVMLACMTECDCRLL